MSEGPQEKKPEPVAEQISANALDKYQIELSGGLLLLLFILNRFEQLRPYTSLFLHLQNKYPNSEYYDIDFNDVYFVLMAILAATFFRASTIYYILSPLTDVLKIGSRKSKQRFVEQSWYLIYYSISFIMGFKIYYQSDYFLNNDMLYINWPHDQMSYSFKLYYLIELSCWLQQIFILNIEAKRKDHYQMLTHHIITCLLVCGSYYYYFTKIGNVILVMMDIVDIFLSTAKILKYLGFQTICDVFFGLFLVTWILLRHIAYNYIFYHATTQARGLMAAQRCIEGVIQKRCFTDMIVDVFLLLLAGLQVITIVWMYLIGKVAYKVVTGNGAEDVRSDDED